ncbi:MAG: TetR/AcrR family transcriptional regulator [Actinomycetota bacterium]|nr:TetR/AcrR family transcriptional regulator [Actinomycetota bacterium]
MSRDGPAGPAVGLRERKKRQTRQLIAETAATLFAERGYEHVAVLDVAKAAEVSEQTVYNYFPTKQRLVLDREQEFLEAFTQLIRARPHGSSPAAALKSAALARLDEIGSTRPDQARGGLGYLATISPEVRRLSLEMTDRLADAMAGVIVEPADRPPTHVARLQGIALASVFQTITDEVGRREVARQDHTEIAVQLRPIVEDLFDTIDRWLCAH